MQAMVPTKRHKDHGHNLHKPSCKSLTIWTPPPAHRLRSTILSRSFQCLRTGPQTGHSDTWLNGFPQSRSNVPAQVVGQIFAKIPWSAHLKEYMTLAIRVLSSHVAGIESCNSLSLWIVERRRLTVHRKCPMHHDGHR